MSSQRMGYCVEYDMVAAGKSVVFPKLWSTNCIWSGRDVTITELYITQKRRLFWGFHSGGYDELCDIARYSHFEIMRHQLVTTIMQISSLAYASALKINTCSSETSTEDQNK
jgi:hypothetical protein